MAETHIRMGNCGMHTTIRASVDDADMVTLEVESECPAIRSMTRSLPPLNALDIGRTIFGSSIYQLANEHLKHVSCVVPAAILRTVEVAAGIALPDDTQIQVQP